MISKIPSEYLGGVDPSDPELFRRDVVGGYKTDMGNGVMMHTQASSAGSPSAGYFDPRRAYAFAGNLTGGDFSATESLAPFWQKSAWPLWLGIVGVGAAVVLLKRGK